MIPIAAKIKHFLDCHRITYRVFNHERASSLSERITQLDIPSHEMLTLKFYELKNNPLAIVFPFNRKVQLLRLKNELGSDLTSLSEEQMNRYFIDCEPFAFPPFGEPYEIKTYFDKSILKSKYVYFVPGSHTAVVQISLDDFRFLTSGVPFLNCTEIDKTLVQFH